MTEKLIYLALCAAAFGFAAHFPLAQRRAAMIVAAALLGNWIVCEWTWTAYAPQILLARVGLPIRATDVWCVADAACGVLAVTLAWRHSWAWALWAISVIQSAFHQLWQINWVAEPAYTWWLDKLFMASVAVFLLWGGRGLAERIAVRFDRRGDAVHSYGTARERSP